MSFYYTILSQLVFMKIWWSCEWNYTGRKQLHSVKGDVSALFATSLDFSPTFGQLQIPNFFPQASCGERHKNWKRLVLRACDLM